MTRQRCALAIVFADISGSTRLYESLGDVMARTHVSKCLAAMIEQTGKHGGTLIKTIGDEIMCTFPGADQAVDAAMSMQACVLAGHSDDGSDPAPVLAIRVGLHHGPAIVEDGDVFGDAVNVAARMAGLAKGGQIITTRATAEALPPALRQTTRHLDRIAVKGKAGEIDIFEVLWRVEDVTRIAAGLLKTQIRTARLALSYKGQSFDLDTDMASIVLGRGTNADLVVNESMASREHARIECRRGKFVLTDVSTNGTYVLSPSGTSYLRREELVLSGEGKITLGRNLNVATEVVTYSTTEQ